MLKLSCHPELRHFPKTRPRDCQQLHRLPHAIARDESDRFRREWQESQARSSKSLDQDLCSGQRQKVRKGPTPTLKAVASLQPARCRTPITRATDEIDLFYSEPIPRIRSSLSAVLCLIVLIALLACYVPALRAAGIDSMAALRAD